jgi:ribosomal protein L11 methyltransferase
MGTALVKSYPAVVIRPHQPSPDFAELAAAVFDDHGVTALEEIEHGAALRAFFPDAAARDFALQAARAAFPRAAVAALSVPDEDWAARSQASLRAVRVGALTVAPPWDLPSDNAAMTIVIQPSMGFGTGHHATTRLCLAALQIVEVRGKSVIDVGTGSGVLALAAAKLGAASVLAIDNDPDAIANALDNVGLNGQPRQLDVRCASLDDRSVAARAPYDVLLANLTGAVLVRYASTLKALARGRLILSGLREEEQADVASAFGRGVRSVAREDGWVCLVLGDD